MICQSCMAIIRFWSADVTWTASLTDHGKRLPASVTVPTGRRMLIMLMRAKEVYQAEQYVSGKLYKLPAEFRALVCDCPTGKSGTVHIHNGVGGSNGVLLEDADWIVKDAHGEFTVYHTRDLNRVFEEIK